MEAATQKRPAQHLHDAFHSPAAGTDLKHMLVNGVLWDAGIVLGGISACVTNDLTSSNRIRRAYSTVCAVGRALNFIKFIQ